MTPSARKRLDYLFDKLFEEPHEVQKQKFFPRVSDVETQMRANICAPADMSKPTRGIVHVFTVTEPKEGARNIYDEKVDERRRMIHWSEAHNRAEYESLLTQWESQLPTQLARVLANFARTYDLEAGFYQISIPKEFRHLFRFQDDAGEWYEMCKLPMGHQLAPEILSLILATLAFFPDISVETVEKVSRDIHIDNLRFTSDDEKALEYQHERFIERCRIAHATLGEQEHSHQYIFCGVLYDHRRKRVCLSDRTCTKLQRTTFDTVEELEAGISRLIYASTVLRSPLYRHFDELQFARKILSQLSKGIVDLESPITNSYIVRKLTMWRDEMHRNVPVVPIDTEKVRTAEFLLYTDASNVGWGSVLIDLTYNTLRSYGKKWDEHELSTHINEKEFQALIRSIEHWNLHEVHVNCLVDNRSVLASTKKLYSRSENLNFLVTEYDDVLAKRCITVDIAYVRSGENMADAPSRQFDVSG